MIHPKTSRRLWGVCAIMAAAVLVGLLLRSLYVGMLHDDLRLEMWRNLSFVTADEAKALIHQGVSVDDRGVDGQTLLMVAAQEGLLDTVQTLIALGADVNAQDAHGKTASMLAKQSGQTKVVELLRRTSVTTAAGPPGSIR